MPLNRTGVDFGIYTTMPNPTRAGMLIGYAMPKSGFVRLELFTLGGQRVRTLFAGQARAGMNAVQWDGTGDNGRGLSPGTYFVTLKAAERISTKKVVLFR